MLTHEIPNRTHAYLSAEQHALSRNVSQAKLNIHVTVSQSLLPPNMLACMHVSKFATDTRTGKI